MRVKSSGNLHANSSARRAEFCFARIRIHLAKERQASPPPSLIHHPRSEIFPKSKTEFFWKAVDAQITFLKDEKGKVIKGNYQHSGKNIEVHKIE